MARSKGGRRDNNYISNVSLPRRPVPKKWDYVAFNNYLTNNRALKWRAWHEHEDRRRFHPLQAAAPALSLNQRRSLLTVARRPALRNSLQSPLGMDSIRKNVFTTAIRSVGFAHPRRVLVCLRRKMRKEIMHAFGHAGKGGQKAPIKNFLSNISCAG